MIYIYFYMRVIYMLLLNCQVLKAMGLLRLGHLVEVDRSALVAGYAGQTAIKTRQVIYVYIERGGGVRVGANPGSSEGC